MRINVKKGKSSWWWLIWIALSIVLTAAKPTWATKLIWPSLEEKVREAEVIVQGTIEQVSWNVEPFEEETFQKFLLFQSRGVLIGQEILKGELRSPLILTLSWIQNEQYDVPVGHAILNATRTIWFLKRWSENPDFFTPISVMQESAPEESKWKKDIKRLVEKNRWFRTGFGASPVESFPESLIDAYARFMEAVRTGDQEAIEVHCLPQSITFTSVPRPEASRRLGQDMNLPFLKQGFSGLIWSIRKEAEDRYMIRTGTSCLYFVNTPASGWRMYRYGDKPIE